MQKNATLLRGPASSGAVVRRSRRCSFLFSIYCAVCSALLCALPGPGFAQPALVAADGGEVGDVIAYADGRLTIDVVELPLPTVLREIGKQTGARVQAQGLEGVTVTDEFSKMPLDAAVKRLVAGRNFTLIYGKKHSSDGKVVGRELKELQVFGGGRAPEAPPRAAARENETAPVRSPEAVPAERKTASAAQAPPMAERVDREAEMEAGARPPRAMLANPVSAAIMGGEPEAEPDSDPEQLEPQAEADPGFGIDAHEDGPWIQGYDQDAPMYEDDGMGAEVETYDESYDAGFYGDVDDTGYEEHYDEQ